MGYITGERNRRPQWVKVMKVFLLQPKLPLKLQYYSLFLCTDLVKEGNFVIKLCSVSELVWYLIGWAIFL